jgi:hypothetical protein
MADNELNARQSLPSSNRADDSVQGHWLLARLGKRVLRPGGVELTRTMLARADVSGADVLELAPGLGRTATEIIARRPRSYVAPRVIPMPPSTRLSPRWHGCCDRVGATRSTNSR